MDERKRNAKSLLEMELGGIIRLVKEPQRTPNWLWQASLLIFLAGSLTGLGLALALKLGWRSPTPHRPPDWRANWSVWTYQGDGTVEVLGEAYQLALSEPNQVVWAVSGSHPSDFDLEADLRSLTAGEDNGYGVLYSYQDRKNYILFAVSGDGNYTVVAAVDGEMQTLRAWQPWPHVRRGAAHNRLRVRCEASTCRFYVNGEFAAEVEGATLGPGQVGLFAQTYSDPSLTVLCEGLRFWSLQPTIKSPIRQARRAVWAVR